MFAEHIVQVVPEPAEGMPLSRQVAMDYAFGFAA